MQLSVKFLNDLVSDRMHNFKCIYFCKLYKFTFRELTICLLHDIVLIDLNE